MSKLTIVLCGRNDQYGGDFLKRLSNSLKWNSDLACRHQVHVELIFVEYNPPSDMPSLSTLEIWPQSKFWETRIIPYRDESNPDNFEEFKAKNIGIERGSGEYMLSSNVDILLPEGLFEQFSRLGKDTFFVADRLNIRTHSEDWNKMLVSADEYCLKGGIFLRPKFVSHKLYYSLMPSLLVIRREVYRTLPFLLKPGVQFLLDHHFPACGDFMLAHRSVWNKVGRFREGTKETAHVDSLFLLKVLSHKVHVREIPFPILHQNHDHRYSFRNPTNEMQQMLQILLDEVNEFRLKGEPIRDDSQKKF